MLPTYNGREGVLLMNLKKMKDARVESWRRLLLMKNASATQGELLSKVV